MSKVKFTDSNGQDQVEEMVVLGGGTTADGSAAGLVVPVDVPIDARGNYPSTWYLEWAGLAGAADTDVLYTSGDVSMYNTHVLENVSGVAVEFFVSVDGTNFAVQPAAALQANDLDTTVLKASIINNRVATLTGKYKAIQIRQGAAGSIAAGSVRGAHSVI